MAAKSETVTETKKKTSKSKPSKSKAKGLGKDEILESISSLTVLELAELVKGLEEKFGVSASAPVAVAAPAAGGQVEAGQAVAEDEKTEFTVILQNAGAKKIQVIKAVRELTSLGLKEAKELVDSAPKPVKEDVGKEEAGAAKARLEEAGATVEIK